MEERKKQFGWQKQNGERLNQVMLNTKEYFSLCMHITMLVQAPHCSFLACETLQAAQISVTHQTFSKQTRLEGISAIRNTLKELTDFDPADVSLSLCKFHSKKKRKKEVKISYLLLTRLAPALKHSSKH